MRLKRMQKGLRSQKNAGKIEGLGKKIDYLFSVECSLFKKICAFTFFILFFYLEKSVK